MRHSYSLPTIHTPSLDNEAIYRVTEHGEVTKEVKGKCYPWTMDDFVAEELLRMLTQELNFTKEGEWVAIWHDANPKEQYDPYSKLFRKNRPTTFRVYYTKGDKNPLFCGVWEEPAETLIHHKDYGLVRMLHLLEQGYKEYQNVEKHVLDPSNREKRLIADGVLKIH